MNSTFTMQSIVDKYHLTGTQIDRVIRKRNLQTLQISTKPLNNMTILVTGGTGRTGGAVAHRLHESNVPFLILTRSGNVPSPYANHACRFDFLDPTTFENPFSTAKDTVKAIYIVVPLTLSDDIATPVIEFIDFAARKGVKRFVLLSSNTYEPPTRICGAVHQHLMDHKGDIEYAIVRPTWFMGKLSLFRFHTFRINIDQVFAPSQTASAESKSQPSEAKEQSARPQGMAWPDGYPPTTSGPLRSEPSRTPRSRIQTTSSSAPNCSATTT